MITPEMFKKFQRIPWLDYKDYLQWLIKRFHEIFNKRRGLYGHIFNPLTFEEKTTYSPEKYTKLRKINKEDQTIAFYTLLCELFISKEKIR
jgi:hypothetical protein